MRDGLPTTSEEMLRHWLSYRYPHYDEMEVRASATLAGTRTATVRVGWDGEAGSAQDWHVTLFTLANETPDAEQTRAAAEVMKPAGMLLHHIVSAAPRPDAANPDDPRIARIEDAVREARVTAQRAAAATGDVRTPVDQRWRAIEAAAAAATGARTAVEHAITEGLLARAGFLLVPAMIVKPRALADWVSYQALLTLRSGLDGDGRRTHPWRPEGVAVCRSCTAVFVPRRRRTGEFCRLCANRPAVGEVLGQRALAPGETQTIRAPKLVGNLIVGWKSVTAGLCPECSQPFLGRRDATTCRSCSPPVRQRRHRIR